MTQNTQPTGIVKWFSYQKGYGFIIPDSPTITHGEDIFAHHTAIADQEGYRNLHEGDHVRFDLVDQGKGPQAQNIHRLHTHATMSDPQHLPRLPRPLHPSTNPFARERNQEKPYATQHSPHPNRRQPISASPRIRRHRQPRR